VTWSLIAANIFVFVIFQQGGQNDNVTLAFCQVPAEIVTGQDIVTEPAIREVEYEGQQYQVSVPGLRPTPIPVYLTLITGIFYTVGGCISWVICGFFLSSVTMLKMTWAMPVILSSI